VNLLREKLPTGGIKITHLQVVGSDSTKAKDIGNQFIADIRRHVDRLLEASMEHSCGAVRGVVGERTAH